MGHHVSTLGLDHDPHLADFLLGRATPSQQHPSARDKFSASSSSSRTAAAFLPTVHAITAAPEHAASRHIGGVASFLDTTTSSAVHDFAPPSSALRSGVRLHRTKTSFLPSQEWEAYLPDLPIPGIGFGGDRYSVIPRPKSRIAAWPDGGPYGGVA